MKGTNSLKIAWLFPSLERGSYWHPIWSEFCKTFPQTIVYTGYWTGFSAGFENTFNIEVVGETRYIRDEPAAEGYNCRFIYAPPSVVKHLVRFQPDVIFTSGFSIWTVLALLLKFWFHWRVVVLYDGNSPGIDHRSSKVRYIARRLMAWFIDAYAANSQTAKEYLLGFIGAKETQLFSRPYLVPQATALLQKQLPPDALPAVTRPTFIFVGDLIARKGVHSLLAACEVLQQRGVENYTVVIVGDGVQRSELEEAARSRCLSDRLVWTGWVEYGSLGSYFRHADVFVFPTLEDIWGMVVLEAMVLGKPVLCSQWAGSCEMVTDGKNGYVFDPNHPEELADAMQRLIQTPELIATMGQQSEQMVTAYTPQAASQLFIDIVSSVLNQKSESRSSTARFLP